jgi:hypothetical protein
MAGAESACGWCKDKWDLSRQITPRVLMEAVGIGSRLGRRVSLLQQRDRRVVRQAGRLPPDELFPRIYHRLGTDVTTAHLPLRVMVCGPSNSIQGDGCPNRASVSGRVSGCLFGIISNL